MGGGDDDFGFEHGKFGGQAKRRDSGRGAVHPRVWDWKGFSGLGVQDRVCVPGLAERRCMDINTIITPHIRTNTHSL